jgi:hypothetical protein
MAAFGFTAADKSSFHSNTWLLSSI